MSWIFKHFSDSEVSSRGAEESLRLQNVDNFSSSNVSEYDLSFSHKPKPNINLWQNLFNSVSELDLSRIFDFYFYCMAAHMRNG